jgi:hypothetical protein
MLSHLPYKPHLHKFIKEILKDKYPAHAELIERMATQFVTEKDVTNLCQMIADLYGAAYLACIEQNKAELARLGIKADVSMPQSKA